MPWLFCDYHQEFNKLWAGMIKLLEIQDDRLNSGCMIFHMQWMGIGHLPEVLNFYAQIEALEG